MAEENNVIIPAMIMDKGKIPVSVSINAYNDESRILACLESVRNFEDIVLVVDSKTTDRTVEVAREFGCKVFVEEWKGSGPQKQSAIDKCEYDWVLLLDSDELLHPDGIGLFRNQPPPGISGFTLDRKNFIGDRWIKCCGWWPDRLIRFFDRRTCRMQGIAHPKVVSDGPVAHLDAVIEHYSYESYSHMLEKFNRSTSRVAADLYEKGRGATVLSPVIHGSLRFLKTFFLKRGFAGGLDGFVLSVLSGAYSFFKYAKLIEFRRKGHRSPKQ